MLRVARRFAAEADPDSLLRDLIVEAVALVDGEVGVVYRWDEREQRLSPVAISSDGEALGATVERLARYDPA